MEYSALIAFIIATSITPGPNNALILASGVNHGIRKSLPHLFGIDVGFSLMVFAVGLGAGTLFKQFPVLQVGLKIIGVFYLVYLAYKVASAPTGNVEAENKKPFTFIQALLFQWVNPKAWVMSIGSVVTFTSSSGSYFSQILTITLVFMVFGLPCTGLWLLFGVSLKKLISNPTRLRVFNIFMAVLLVISLIPTIRELYVQYNT